MIRFALLSLLSLTANVYAAESTVDIDTAAKLYQAAAMREQVRASLGAMPEHIRQLFAADSSAKLSDPQLAAVSAAAVRGFRIDVFEAPALQAFAEHLDAVPVLLVVLARRPAWLRRHRILAPFFAAGGPGFLRATAARLPHVVTMVAGLWLGLRLWGVALPLARGLVVLSVAVLVTVLPIAPSGLGTLELALVELTSAYAPGPTAASQRASVLAFSFVYHLFAIAAQAAVGLLCLAWLARRARIDRARGDGAAPECAIAPLPALGQAID